MLGVIRSFPLCAWQLSTFWCIVLLYFGGRASIVIVTRETRSKVDGVLDGKVAKGDSEAVAKSDRATSGKSFPINPGAVDGVTVM